MIEIETFVTGKRRSSGGHPRREESSISFRHFLQNEAGHSSNTPYPDLYSCSRQERPLIDGSIDPESPDLPDFVQDHLAVEHMYFNDGSTVQSVNLQNLPDFASCMLRHENNEIRHRQQLGNAFKFRRFAFSYDFSDMRWND